MDRAFVSLCALLVNAVFGGPKRFYDAIGVSQAMRYPVKVLRDIERRLNRDHRSISERETRGYILVAVVVGSCFTLAWFLSLLFGSSLQFVELAVLALVLPVRPVFDIAFGIRKHLQANQLTTARSFLEGTAWRHHAVLDEHGLARAAVELSAIGFSEKIFAAIFWYLLLGLSGLLTVVAINLMRDHMTQSADLEQGFGSATWKLHTLIHFIPARRAAVLWVVASMFLSPQKWQDMTQTFFAAVTSAMPARPLTLLIAGKAIGLSLGGAGSIYAREATATGPLRAQPLDIHRALYLFSLLHLLLFVVMGLLV
jgi:adenosylcobinamide-phosphate synthase